MNEAVTTYTDLDSGKTLKTIHTAIKKTLYDVCKIGGELWIVLKKDSVYKDGSWKISIGVKKMPNNVLPTNRTNSAESS